MIIVKMKIQITKKELVEKKFLDFQNLLEMWIMDCRNNIRYKDSINKIQFFIRLHLSYLVCSLRVIIFNIN